MTAPLPPASPPASSPPAPDGPAAGPVIFTFGGIWRGVKRIQPFALGIFAYGIAFGLVAIQAKLTLGQALVMSAIVYSGSAQLAAVGVLSAGAGGLWASFMALVGTILVMNARYLLFSATLRPWLGQVSPLKAYSTLFLLGDAGWLMAMRAREEGEHDAGFVLGTGAGPFAGWLLGTYLGGVAVDFAPDPTRMGFDFLLVAFAAAMLTGMFKGRKDIVVVIVATLVALGVASFAGFGAAVIAAGLGGGLAAYARAPAEKRA